MQENEVLNSIVRKVLSSKDFILVRNPGFTQTQKNSQKWFELKFFGEKLIFSNESKFNINGNDSKQFID